MVGCEWAARPRPVSRSAPSGQRGNNARTEAANSRALPRRARLLQSEVSRPVLRARVSSPNKALRSSIHFQSDHHTLDAAPRVKRRTRRLSLFGFGSFAGTCAAAPCPRSLTPSDKKALLSLHGRPRGRMPPERPEDTPTAVHREILPFSSQHGLRLRILLKSGRLLPLLARVWVEPARRARWSRGAASGVHQFQQPEPRALQHRPGRSGPTPSACAVPVRTGRTMLTRCGRCELGNDRRAVVRVGRLKFAA
eukprot:scaffold51376_cov62-Phaeocystis_antarctica.AAC.6